MLRRNFLKFIGLSSSLASPAVMSAAQAELITQSAGNKPFTTHVVITNIHDGESGWCERVRWKQRFDNGREMSRRIVIGEWDYAGIYLRDGICRRHPPSWTLPRPFWSANDHVFHGTPDQVQKRYLDNAVERAARRGLAEGITEQERDILLAFAPPMSHLTFVIRCRRCEKESGIKKTGPYFA